MEANGEFLVQDDSMTRVFLADGQTVERSALRLMLEDLKMDMAGEAADWAATLVGAPGSHADMLLVDFNLLPPDSKAAMRKMRRVCPNAKVIILIGKLDARQEAGLSAGADGYISKGESPERVAEHLVAASRIKRL